MKDDIPLKIFATLVESELPLGRKDICSSCNIQPQLFDYWINTLLQNKVVIQDERKRYSSQKIFKDKNLPAMIIPLIKVISDNLKTEGSDKETCVSANMSLYMKYLSEDLK